MSERSCPECGCPIGDEKVCPDCGCPIETSASSESKDKPTTSNYNEEEEPFTPFSPTSWFFRTPPFLNKFPQRGDYAKAHPFLGWVFNQWHVSYRGNGNRAAFDTLNNIFLLCNLIFKTILYSIAWGFFKMFWWNVAFVVTLIVGGMVARTSETALNIFSILTIILYAVFCVFSALVFLCGCAESLRRYISPMYNTFMRICRRFSISITKSVRENNLNA